MGATDIPINLCWAQDVEAAERFYSTHNAGFTPYAYPKDLFMKFVKENNGYFPVKIEALPEGTVANIHVHTSSLLCVSLILSQVTCLVLLGIASCVLNALFSCFTLP